MKPIDKTAVTTLALPKLRSQFGKLVHEQSPKGPIDFRGLDFSAHVRLALGRRRAMLELGAPKRVRSRSGLEARPAQAEHALARANPSSSGRTLAEDYDAGRIKPGGEVRGWGI